MARDYLDAQRNLGVLLGPFGWLEVLEVHISCCGVIPKLNQPGHWRLIVDLFHPEGRGVNNGVSGGHAHFGTFTWRRWWGDSSSWAQVHRCQMYTAGRAGLCRYSSALWPSIHTNGLNALVTNFQLCINSKLRIFNEARGVSQMSQTLSSQVKLHRFLLGAGWRSHYVMRWLTWKIDSNLSFLY